MIVKTFMGRSTLSKSARMATVPWTLDWKFAAFSLMCWAFAPGVRRFFDWNSGSFHAIDILSLVPLISLLPLIRYALKPEFVSRVPKALTAFLAVWSATLFYGFIVAAINGNPGAGLYEFLQYELPAVFGFWLAGQEIPSDLASNRIVRLLLIIGTIVGIYGIAQWIQPAPWDVAWIEGSRLSSETTPFQLRIFSTLNSTGPAADFFAQCAIFTLPWLRFKNAYALGAIMVLLTALLLTLTRAAWVGIAIGIATYLLMSPSRLRALPFVASGVLAIVLFAGTLPALLGSESNGDAIATRIQTLTDVDHDASANLRQSEIVDSLDEAARVPFGLGLGSFGPSSRLSNAVDAGDLGRILDGGYIARLLSLGWLGFALYIAVAVGAPLWLVVMGVRRSNVLTPERGAIVALGISIGVYQIWNDFATDSHLGVTGLLFWIAISLGFRSIDDSKATA